MHVIHRDSDIADNDLSTPYKVEDSYLGEAAIPMLSGLNLPSFDMLQPEDARCSASLELVDNPDWLLDAEMGQFVTFTPDDSMVTGNGHPPTPPDSPDYNSSKTTAAPCSSTSDVFCPPTPRSSTVELRRKSDDVQITGALIRLQLRLHETARLPTEILSLQPKNTLIEETLEASQTFTDLLRLMSQGQSQSQAFHASTDSPEPNTSPNTSNLTATSCSSSSCYEILSTLSTSSSPPPAISASVSLLTLLCYLGIIKAYENVLRLLRSVLKRPVDNATNPGATNPGSFGAADMLLLPQISIGSIHPLAMACPRTQVAVLALLLAAKFDEVRGGIRQLVAASSALPPPSPSPSSSPGSFSSAAGDGCERPKAKPATEATDLTSLAGEGLRRAEAELKRQLVAMTQLLA